MSATSVAKSIQILKTYKKKLVLLIQIYTAAVPEITVVSWESYFLFGYLIDYLVTQMFM